MNVSTEQLEELAGLGLSVAQIAGALRVLERSMAAETEDARRLREMRERDRNRKRIERVQGQSKDESKDSPRNVQEQAPRARVVIPSLPSEEVKNPPETSSQAPKGAKRATRIPADFVPDLAVAMAEGFTRPEAEREAAKFIDYFRGAPGQKGVKHDWPATWRNWCRNACDRGGARATGPPNLATRRSSIAMVHQMARGREIEQPDQQGNGVSGVDARSSWPGPVASHRSDAQRAPTLDLEPIRDRR